VSPLTLPCDYSFSGYYPIPGQQHAGTACTNDMQFQARLHFLGRVIAICDFGTVKADAFT
jgi:hypothetical protein